MTHARGEDQSYQLPQDVSNAPSIVYSLDEYINKTGGALFLGMRLRKQQVELDSGRKIQGLEVLEIIPGTPAANAGLHASRQIFRNILKVTAPEASNMFLLARFMEPVAAVMSLGETPALIIAVDASRVTGVEEFEDQIREIEPGEIIYLTVLHDHNRQQIRLLLPATQN